MTQLRFIFNYLAHALDCSAVILHAIWQTLSWNDRCGIHLSDLAEELDTSRDDRQSWTVYARIHLKNCVPSMKILARHNITAVTFATTFPYTFSAENQPIYRSVYTGELLSRSELLRMIKTFCNTRQELLNFLDAGLYCASSEAMQYRHPTTGKLYNCYPLATPAFILSWFGGPWDLTVSEIGYRGFRINNVPCSRDEWYRALDK